MLINGVFPRDQITGYKQHWGDRLHWVFSSEVRGWKQSVDEQMTDDERRMIHHARVLGRWVRCHCKMVTVGQHVGSREYQGTPDAIGYTRDGQLAVFEMKTIAVSQGTLARAVLQAAAYARATGAKIAYILIATPAERRVLQLTGETLETAMRDWDAVQDIGNMIVSTRW